MKQPSLRTPRPSRHWRRRHRIPRRFEQLETRVMLHGDSGPTDDPHDHPPDYDPDGFHIHAQLVISINGERVDIPNQLGIGTTGFLSPIHTHDPDNVLHMHNIAGEEVVDFLTLNDFFETWRTKGGLGGNNPNAILTENQLFDNFVDEENSLRMFVNGVATDEFQNYVFRPEDNIVLTYGSNPIVVAETNLGPILIELFPDEASGTVENFLNYVNDGDYENAIFHRSVSEFVIQTGGFTSESEMFVSSSQFDPVPTDPPIQNEFGISNRVGTIAMAKLSGDPHSATSQWFVNLDNNGPNLDGQNGGFTVFGQVLGLWTGRDDVSRSTVDIIAGLETVNRGGAFTNLPLTAASNVVRLESFSGRGSIAGTVFDDANFNGVIDSTEAGLEGVVVYVDANDDGVRNGDELFTTTNTFGAYRLNLDSGNYLIRQEVPSGFVEMAPLNGHGETVLIAEDVTNVDFLDAQLGSNDDRLSVQEDVVEATLDVLQNDASGGEGLTITSVTPTDQNGIVTIADDSLTLLYTPAANFSGTETFGYTASNGESASVSVVVQPVNDPPTAVDDHQTIQEDTITTFRPLENDSQAPDSGESLRIIDVALSVNFGVVTLQDDGESVVYEPPANFIGTDSFSYTISDRESGGLTSQARVIVEIVEGNDDPTAAADVFDVDEDSADNVFDVLVNDTFAPDLDEELSIVSVDSFSAGGSAQISQDSLQILYTPRPNAFGLESFTYQITDGRGGFAVAGVTVNVAPLNDPPTGNADTFSVTKDTGPHTLAVLTNDSIEPDTDEQLTITSVGATSAGGRAVISGGGTTIDYTPAPGFTGDESFTYTIGDGSELTTTANVTVTVQDFEPSDLSGFVFIDANQDGTLSDGESPLGNVHVQLTGTDFLGETVNLTRRTGADGAYRFAGLAPGSYTITQTQPDFVLDGPTMIGTQGGAAQLNSLSIELEEGVDGTGNNFGELGRDARFVGLRDFFAIKPELSVLAMASTDGMSWYAVVGSTNGLQPTNIGLSADLAHVELTVRDEDLLETSFTVATDGTRAQILNRVGDFRLLGLMDEALVLPSSVGLMAEGEFDEPAEAVVAAAQLPEISNAPLAEGEPDGDPGQAADGETVDLAFEDELDWLAL